MARPATARAPLNLEMVRTRAATVDDYLTRLAEPNRAIAESVRRLVAAVAPRAGESIKWGMLHYACGGHFLYVEAAGDHVKLGFFRGADLDDPDGLLEGGGKRLRHVKLRRPEEVQQPGLTRLLQQAYRIARR